MQRIPVPSPRRDPVFLAALLLVASAGAVLLFPGGDRSQALARVVAISGVLFAAAVHRPIESAGSRTFWRLIACGLLFFLSAQVWLLLAGGALPRTWERSQDLLFLGRYLFLVMALELRPDSTRPGRSEEQLRLLDTSGAVLFLFALIAYVVVSPPFQELTVDRPRLWMRELYLVLDAFLVVRALTLRVQSPNAHWRTVYGWLGLTFALRALNNFLSSPSGGEVAIGADPPIGPLWLLLIVPMIIAARLPPDPASASALPTEDDQAARTRLAPLVAYAFTFPVFHFLMERLGIVTDDTAGPRELVVLGFLASAAMLLWIYQRVLIRENQRLERERALMTEQSAQATRLEAIGRLAGGVAHDFNNLLTVIRGRTELMLVEHQEDASLHEDLTAIRDATRRGEGVTRQLLAFGRRQMLRPEVLDVGAVVGEMVPLLRSAVSDEVRLTVAVRDPAPLIVADQGQVEMALLNLAVNAREAMPGGGTIAIIVDDVELDEETAAEIPDARPGRYVLLTVQDTGRGMDEATRTRIFEPFFTTKPFGSGAGLGLPAVHGFIRQSGGAVRVESEPGRGATFRIYLPRVDPTTNGKPPA
jgi:signal transduction histidine kinase